MSHLGITLHLKAHPAGLKAEALAQKLGCSLAAVHGHLRKMSADGLATRYPFTGGPLSVWTLTDNLDAAVAAYEAGREVARVKALELKRISQREIRGKRRYDWPDVSAYTPPQRLVASVWDLATPT